jgi:protein-S-isoprenylcysteine O-methyltransferase Ste14
MNASRIEDMLGKALMLAIFTFVATQNVFVLVGKFRSEQITPFLALSAFAQLLSLLFVGLVLWLTLSRLPPRKTASGIEPRVSAIAGTFLLFFLVYLPAGSAGFGVTLVATLMILIGTVLSIYCLYYLGKSFSIMASARSLVSTGPYGFVRHPLYLAEAITVAGVILAHWSPLAVLLGLSQMAFQVRRMFNEEAVLRSAFPEYDDYAASVPMLIPDLGRWRMAEGRQ